TGLGKAARDRNRPFAGACAEPARARRRVAHRQRRVERSEGVRPDDRVPARREAVELSAQQRPEDPIEPGHPDERVRREPGEAPAERAPSHEATWRRISCPGRTPNISAAFPPLIAIATFRYESS